MFKVTPNPPNGPDLKLNQAAHRAIDHYLNAGAEPLETPPPHTTTLFSVADDVRSEVLIADSYETFSSVTALLLGLSDELKGNSGMWRWRFTNLVN